MYELLFSWISPLAEQSFGFYLIALCICIIAGFFLLIKGGDWLSDHSSNLAFQLGVPPVVVGLTIVSIATSTPELFTSLSAIRSNSPGLILGNIIGSNIANIGLILGIALLIGTVPTQNAVSVAQRICLFLITAGFCSFLFFSQTNEIGRFAGMVLLSFFLVYLTTLTVVALRKKTQHLQSSDYTQLNPITSTSIGLSIIMLSVSALALWTGADSLVYGAKSLSELAGVPEEFVGFTLLAIGTSLPELAASLSLVRKKQTSMLLGNIVGSNLFNISLIGGLAGILGPVRTGSPNPWIDYLFLLVITIIFIYWLRGKILQKVDGILLLLVYFSACICTWFLNA